MFSLFQVLTTFFEFPMIFDVETGHSDFNQANADIMMSGSTCAIFSPDDQLAVAGSTDGSVRVIQVDSSKYLYRFQHRSTVSKACFSQDSSTLVTSGFGTILIWCLRTGDLQHTLYRHQDFVMDLTFTCEGRFLVTCSKDKKILVWDFAQRTTVTSFYSHCAIKSIQVAPDLSSVLFCPEHVAYLGILQPNPTLWAVSQGKADIDLPDMVQKAQGLALAFSTQKVSTQSSKSCIVL